METYVQFSPLVPLSFAALFLHREAKNMYCNYRAAKWTKVTEKICAECL